MFGLFVCDFQRSIYKFLNFQKYNKPLFTNVSYLILYKKNRKSFNAKQVSFSLEYVVPIISKSPVFNLLISLLFLSII